MSLRDTVILVDQHDLTLGVADKMAAHEQGLLHRAFSVMLYRYHNNKLEFLLQQRAADKYHCGGLWTNTCCSHPQPKDELITSAKNRLQELVDIDIDNLQLINIGNFIYKAEFNNGLIEHELDHVLLGEYAKLPNTFNKAEVQALQWLDAQEIKNKYLENNLLFTPWFIHVYNICTQYFD
jgi:isopentenyl-diphosphate delta-isomerase